MQKTKHWLMTIAMLLCSITASAKDFYVDDICYNVTSSTNKTVEVAQDYLKHCEGAVTIPSTITHDYWTYNVTSIGSYAFSGCSKLTSITIPESVTSIGNSAFLLCSGLTSITIHEGLKSIGNYAFSECSKLTSIAIPEGLKSIGNSAFSECSKLASITIPESVTSIGNSAFWGCESLTFITIPESVTSIGRSAFSGCSSLTSITIPEGVTSIEEYAFSSCSSLTSITIPESVTSIGEYAFSGCSSLTSITIPEGVTSIGRSAFWGCSSLTSITIPEGVTSIEEDAFLSCSSLTSITIPESVTSIGEYAFSGCNNLYKVINFSTLPIYKGSNNYGDVAYYAKKVLNGKELNTVGDYQFYTSNGVHYLANYSGDDCILVLPNGYNGEDYKIDDCAFYGCRNLTSITIPESVSSIGNYAFLDCASLVEAYFMDGEQTLSLGYNEYKYSSNGEGLFYDCEQLRKVYIGRVLYFETNKSYGYSPFYQKDVDTLIISRKQSKNLRFNTIHKQATLLYIDSDYSKVIPNNIQESCTLHYFNMPYPTSNNKYKDITNYLTTGLGCKAKMEPFGDIQAGFESLTVTLNDTLIIPFIVSPSTNPNVVRYNAVRINESYITPDSANVYECKDLKIGTNYPVELIFSYDNKQYTVSGNVTTKKFNPTFGINVTLTTATIRYNVGDTIGLGKSISEIGVYYDNTHYPTEGKDEWHDLPCYTTIKNLHPRNGYGCQIYCKIDTCYYYSKWLEFAAKYPIIDLVENDKCTQTTANLKVIGTYSDENISPVEIGVMSGYKGDMYDSKYIADENGNVLITGLKPDTTYVMTPYIKYNEDEFYPITGTNRNINTAGIAIACNSVAASATTITVEGVHDAGDATVIEYGFSDYEANTNRTTVTGLEPNSTYTLTYYVTTAEGGTLYQSVTAQTENLTFNTLKAKATSNTRAVICAEANIANEESGTGFEWRRIDAPDLVPSEVVGCAVHDSIMEGVLSNLSANTYYKYRPFYTSASGQSYYGEWMGFGTADAYVYFTPTVHTYATATASANAIRLTGYVLPGSDDIVEQGFEYWAESSATRSSNVTKVTASGQRMSVLLENLEPGTRYKYRAFATTSKETIYGEVQMFETPTVTDVEEMTYHSEPVISSRRGVIYIDNVDENCIVRVFTLSGAKIYEGYDREISVESGIYIIHADAITLKLVVK